MAGWGSSWGGYWGGGLLGSALHLVAAEASVVRQVRVEFSLPLDPAYLPNLNPLSYVIPELTVTGVTLDGNFVVLDTSPQHPRLYEVTALGVRTVDEIFIDPLADSATFMGISSFTEVAVFSTRSDRIRFFCPTERFVLNEALLDPTSFRLLEDHTVEIPIQSVTAETSGNPYSVVLTPSVPLKNTTWYTLLLIGEGIQTVSGRSATPTNHVFQWVADDGRTEVRFDQFTGEVSEGLLGNPDGLVYFSPALDLPVSNSAVQVDEISICTRAYDTYTFPVPVDPIPLYTFSAPLAVSRVGLNSVVLWASPFRLGEATINLHDHQTDTAPQAVDGRCVVEVKEPWDPDYVALLNNPEWHLYDGTPRTFICANNLGPIPPGSDTIIVLVP